MHRPRGRPFGALEFCWTALAVLAAPALAPITAQGSIDTMTLTGHVTPSMGETSIPQGVRVTLRDLDSSFWRMASLDATGRFEFAGVPSDGRYRVTVEAPGRSEVATELDRSSGRVVTLQLGGRIGQAHAAAGGPVALKDLWLDTPAGRSIRKASEDISRDRLGSALRNAEKAVDLNPGLAEAHAVKAMALMKLGKASPAEASLNEAVRLDSENPRALRMLGWLYLGTERPREALDPLTRAARLEPQDAQGLIWLSEALYRVGRYAEAVPPLETVLAADPNCYRASYQLGYAYLQLKRNPEALTAFRSFLSANRDIDPSAVRRIIDRLERQSSGTTGLQAADTAEGPDD
jgi:tetratricopeptide (TPR) repeat protein